MGIAETYLDKRGAAKRALTDLDSMKFILEQTDDRIKELSDQMGAGVLPGDQSGRNSGTIIESADDNGAADHDKYSTYRDDGKIFGQPQEIITLVMRYRQAKEYMDWFGPAWERLTEKEQYLLRASILEDATCTEICDHLGIKEDAYYQRRKRTVDKLAQLLYGK